MNILIIGSGAREHALAYKVAQSARVTTVFVAPGNAGTLLENKVTNVPIDSSDLIKLLAFAKENKVELTIVGPEAPLCAGIVDAFTEQNLPCFGPSRYCAQLEGSKMFSKNFMVEHDIPTAKFSYFTDFAAAQNYVAHHSLPIVIKADGLAAGKGVVIAETHDVAIKTLEEFMLAQSLGNAGKKVLIEEYLTGEEVSFIAICDGETAIPLANSQDHKRRDNGDEGPNTGGMGAYSPTKLVSNELQERIMQQVILPTVNGMRKKGTPYIGFLYAGLMLKNDTINVLEFNCRLGDPEAEVILMRLNNDLVELCQAALNQALTNIKLTWDQRAALCVILAAASYPEKSSVGEVIPSLPAVNAPDTKLFYAGAMLKDGQLVTNGGRILCLTTLGETIKAAQDTAYTSLKRFPAEFFHYRTDIGYKAI